MTPMQELERLVDLSGLKNVVEMLAMICDERATNLARHDAHAAKEWARYASAVESAMLELWD